MNTSDQALLDKALRQFDENTSETMAERAISLQDRRFVFIEGAQWEGEMGEQFENSPRLQINKTQRGHDKIINDYRANRFTVQYRPVGDEGDDDTAELLNGLMHADIYRSKGQLAFDNAFSEGAAGGMGAWRLCNEYEDDSDDKNDDQRIRIDMIADADQCVFFDRASKLYDKSDARHAYVLNPMTPDAFKDEYGDDRLVSWPEGMKLPCFDWYRGDVVWVAEYYEIEHVSRELRIYTRDATGEEFRYWTEDMADGQDEDLKTRGFSRRMRLSHLGQALIAHSKCGKCDFVFTSHHTRKSRPSIELGRQSGPYFFSRLALAGSLHGLSRIDSVQVYPQMVRR